MQILIENQQVLVTVSSMIKESEGIETQRVGDKDRDNESFCEKAIGIIQFKVGRIPF